MIVEGKIFPFKKKIEKLYLIAEKTLQENFDKVCVSLQFVSDEEIRKLNKKFRNIDNVTDVLSFPNLEKKAEQSLKDFKADFVEDQLFLGDIIISKNVAKKQAKDFGHSLKREVCFLALHGLLHLLGFDHVEKEDEKQMQKVAETILQEFGVTR